MAVPQRGGADFEVVRLQDDAALLGPETLQFQDQRLERCVPTRAHEVVYPLATSWAAVNSRTARRGAAYASQLWDSSDAV